MEAVKLLGGQKGFTICERPIDRSGLLQRCLLPLLELFGLPIGLMIFQLNSDSKTHMHFCFATAKLDISTLIGNSDNEYYNKNGNNSFQFLNFDAEIPY